MRVLPIETTEPAGNDAGLGTLLTDRGNLPLVGLDAAVRITGLVSTTALTQVFRNAHDVPLEATYIFPLPDRAAVTAMAMTADGRVVQAELKERGQARQEYDQAIERGQRASIAEEERPDVFTMRVGNIQPGEEVSVALTLVGPLSYEDGEGTYRLPLVVAPRYIPGTPLPGPSVGEGHALDTDAVPDASRITPPVLLPGFPNPIRLTIGVDIDPAGLPLGYVRSSLHAVVREGNHLDIEPGERANRDFILRLSYGDSEAATHSLSLTPDADGGTFRLTILPPTTAAPPRPRDVVLLLDRSGSMSGWKMVAARRAAARIVDTLTPADRFAVITFDHSVDYPEDLGAKLVEGTDRHRFRAVEHLARVEARGGTELLAPIQAAMKLLRSKDRDRVIVLVTDGQVGNEDQILAGVSSGLKDIRVHTVGIDRAVNAGFLGRFAAVGGGRSELVESEDRLDEAMDRIHRRIGAPVVTGLVMDGSLSIVDGTVAPSRVPDLFPGAPVVVAGRYTGSGGQLGVSGRTRTGEAWSATVDGSIVEDPSLASVWARAHLRDLEDRYASASSPELEETITATSLRFGVLCRFTAWLAVDSRVVSEGGQSHRIVQPVELPDQWQEPPAPMMTLAAGYAAPLPMSAQLSMPMDASAPRPGPGIARGRKDRKSVV